MARPLVLHIPHSSRQIPAKERARFLLEDAELDAELLRMTDAFTEERFPSTNAEAGRVVYGVSRLLCDPERFREDVLEPMAAKGMGALYVKTSDGRALRKPIEARERRRLMDRYYHPHHLRLESLVRKTLELEGCCIVVDCHSFANRPYAHEFDQAPHQPDICIGTDSYHTPHWLRDIALQSVQRHGRSVQVNRPFAGCFGPHGLFRQGTSGPGNHGRNQSESVHRGIDRDPDRFMEPACKRDEVSDGGNRAGMGSAPERRDRAFRFYDAVEAPGED
jgi:N-formylglutamate deformylase